MKNTWKSRLDVAFTFEEHPRADSRNRLTALLLLFCFLFFSKGSALAAPAIQSSGPFAELVITRSDPAGLSGELRVDESAQVSLRLTNIPAADFTKFTFSCKYDPALVEMSGFSSRGFFSTSEIIDRNGPEAGSLVINIYPGMHPWQTSGTVIGFDLTGLSAGSLSFDCSISTTNPDSSVIYIPVETIPVNVIKSSQAASVKGNVKASGTVTVSLFSGETLITSKVVDSEGNFEITAPAGEYQIIASSPACLSLSGMLSLSDSAVINLSSADLSAGDINTDGIIDDDDVMILAQNYNSTRITLGVNPDINHDGIVNVLDLEIIAQNFGETSQTSWK